MPGKMRAAPNQFFTRRHEASAKKKAKKAKLQRKSWAFKIK